MVKTLKITPLDPLFFRSPMPFTAGEQDWASSFGFPTPTTLYGAIRSMILSRRNLDKFITEGYTDIGNPNRKGTLKLKTFFVAKEDGEYYFPIPANILVETEKIMTGNKSEERVKRIALSTSTNLPMIVASPVSPQLERFFYIREDGLESKTPCIASKKLSDYLKGEITSNTDEISDSDFLFLSKIFSSEPKIGIKRDKSTKASETNKLYRVAHYRYKNDISLVAVIEGAEDDLNGIFTLGGERRTAKTEEISNNPLEMFTTIPISNRFIVYLMTPAIFVSSWYPQRTISDLYKHGIEIELVSAVVPGYKVISGWDIQKRGPKTLYRAVPAGSVYIYKVKSGSVEEAINSFHGKNISDINPEEGYGFALVGVERKED